MKKTFTLILFLIFVCTLQAQNSTKEIESLEKDFKSFNYKKVLQQGRFLLSDIYTSKQDSLEIYQYMLSSAYALNDSSQAKSIIEELLAKHPDFAPDPVSTSPKIVEFFNIVKQNIKQHDIVEPVQPFVQKETTFVNPVKTSHLISGIIFPGTSHLLTGQKNKGFLYSSISTVIGGGFIYYFFKTDQSRKKYIDATEDSNYDKIYNEYNSDYKTRNILAASYVVWSLYCLYDFNSSLQFQPQYNTLVKSASLNISYSF